MWNNIILYQDWSQIKILYLHGCKINEDSIDNLLKVDWPNLTELRMSLN